jgi:1,4-alpha-glucan branching enzyme
LAPETFERSRLNWDERTREPHRSMLDVYRSLLEVRKREIVPRIAGVNARDAHFEERGAYGVHATWNVDGGQLVLEANMSDVPCPGFDVAPMGRCIYGTPAFTGGIAPAWAVRWSIV